MNMHARQIAKEIFAMHHERIFDDLKSQTVWEELGFTEKDADTQNKYNYDELLGRYGWFWLAVGTWAAYINEDVTADPELIEARLCTGNPEGIDVAHYRAEAIAIQIMHNWFAAEFGEELRRVKSLREYGELWDRRFDYAYGCGRGSEQLDSEISAHAKTLYSKAKTKVEKAEIFANRMKQYLPLVQAFVGDHKCAEFFQDVPELPKPDKSVEDQKTPDEFGQQMSLMAKDLKKSLSA